MWVLSYGETNIKVCEHSPPDKTEIKVCGYLPLGKVGVKI